MSNKTVADIVEYGTATLPHNALSEESARRLWGNFHQQIAIEPPSFLNGHRWHLTSQGWVGQIPVSPDLELRLQPKTRLSNLFGMLEYAYNIRSLTFLPGLTAAESLQEFYSQLAGLLAKRILERSRKGFYHTYRAEDDQLPFVRGRIDLVQAASKPWSLQLQCQYQEHTANIDENRILTWTLWRILRTGYCKEPTLTLVRKAYRTIQAVTELSPYAARDCVGRTYQRLNQDYHPLHALSRFFLDNSGPTYSMGKSEMVPFLVNMENLFEMFVAEWLSANLADPWVLKTQDRMFLDSVGNYRFVPDLVIYDRVTEQARYILDTKYKVPPRPDQNDISQVIAYAHMKQCPEAVLIYPTPLALPLDARSHGIRVRSASFDLGKDLEEAGQHFLSKLGLIEESKLRADGLNVRGLI